jgi:flagellar hook-associated protein 2
MAGNLGISGLASGIDTQATIDQIMQYSRKPLDRLKQQQQILIWKQDTYRSLNSTLSQLRDLAFNLKLQSAYNTRKVTSSNNQAVTATATSSSVNTSYNLEVIKLAQAAQNSSAAPLSIRSKVTGDGFDEGELIEITDTQDFQIKLGEDKSGTITIEAGNYSLKELADEIQTQLTQLNNIKAFGDHALYVKVTSSNELQFYTGLGVSSEGKVVHEVPTITLEGGSILTDLGFQNNANSKELVGSVISENITITATNNKFRIAVGNGSVQEIELSTGTYNISDFVAEIQNKIQGKGGSYANIEVTVNKFNQLRISSTAGDSIRLESVAANNGLATMGFTSGTVSDYPKNNIDTSSSIWNLRDKFMNAGFFEGKSATDTFGFTINGQSFSFSYKTTLDEIIAEINGNTAAGVSVFYDEYNDQLFITATQAGNYNESGSEIQITDTTGVLSKLFNINEANEKSGEDAEVVINGVLTKRKSNTFDMNGVTFTLNGEGRATISVNADTSAISEQVEEFVDKYNEILASLYEKVNEKRPTSGSKYSYYLPLTDDQKKAMTEDQIKSWEEQAKKGLLRGDSILKSAINSIRSSISRVVETPRNLTGVPLTGTINTNGANRFRVTLGDRTEEIVLDEGSYNTKEDYQVLVKDIQRKFDLKFGVGRVKVALESGNNITFTTQNETLTLNSSGQNNGLNAIGFSDGATVKATYNRLSQIGITTGDYTENGKLYLDKDALQKALAEDPDGVIRLLTNYEEATIYPEDKPHDIARKKAAEESSKGIFYKLHEIITVEIKNFTNKAGVTGTVSYSTAIGQALLNLEERIDTYQERLYQEEDRLWNIFNQMEVAMSRMNTQLLYLQNMFGQMSGR